jgi:hypothetical protein
MPVNVVVWDDRRWEWATLRWENGDFEPPTGIDLEAHIAAMARD